MPGVAVPWGYLRLTPFFFVAIEWVKMTILCVCKWWKWFVSSVRNTLIFPTNPGNEPQRTGVPVRYCHYIRYYPHRFHANCLWQSHGFRSSLQLTSSPNELLILWNVRLEFGSDHLKQENHSWNVVGNPEFLGSHQAFANGMALGRLP